jgi:membrane protein required for colicin V production
MELNGFDIVLLVLLGVLLVVGLIKGLARLLIGLAALIGAFLLAAQLHGELAARLDWINASDGARRLIAYLALFFGTLFVGALAAWLARRLLQAAMLGWADRLAGGAVGVLAAALLAALVVLPLVAYSPVGEDVLRDSLLAPYVAVVADLARRLAPDDLSTRYDERIEGLRRYWRERWQAVSPEHEVRVSPGSRPSGRG